MAIPLGDITKAMEYSLERRACDLCAQQSPLTVKPLQLCGRCGGRRYCSVECQRMDWPRHKARCAKRPSAGPNKEPLRTKADRDHDAKVRADEQAMAMESLRSKRPSDFNHLGRLATNNMAAYISEENPTPMAIKALAGTGLRERVASGELRAGLGAHLYCARARLLYETLPGVVRLMDQHRAGAHVTFYLMTFVRDEPSWTREYAALTALFNRAMAGEVPGCRELVLQLLRSRVRTPPAH
tara:strand:- start:25 stop:747 length:723 start_codon:yes stop_codon:yes gene_type:complete